MKRKTKTSLLLSVLLILSMAMALVPNFVQPAYANSVIAYDMVGSTSQNLTSYVNNAPPFSSSADGFGKYQRGISPTIPFAVLDDSLVSYPPDSQGIIDDNNTNEFFGAADTINGDNPSGPVTAVWTFDVSGFDNLELSIDMGAMGDFEASDPFTWEASIDGGTAETVFANTVDEAGSQTYTLAGGANFTLNDPMLVDGVLLNNVLQTFTKPISGSGNELVLTLTLETNGSDEAIAFQNISISGTPIGGGVNVPPTVNNTDPSNGAEYVNVDANIEIVFSEAVTSTGAWFEIVCDATIVPAVASGGSTSYTLDPTSDLPSTAACNVTLLASQVTDQGDPPLNMEQDYSFGFTTNAVCGDPATLIHAVQGPGVVSPITLGQIVTVEGVVVGDFQVSDELNGFFVQEENADFDGDDNTSEGLFIFEGSYDGPDVNEGDLVRVTGQVDEYYTLTELNNISNVLLCEDAPGQYGPIDVTLPEATDGDLEKFEGMYVNVINTMSVAQNYFIGRYGQLTLSSDLTNRLYQPTNQALPNTPESIALADYNARNLLFLDDGVDGTTCGDNPVPVPYLGPAPPAILRSGDHVSNLIGVLDYGQINSGSECWVPSTLGRDYRLQPTQDPVFSTMNPRPSVPDAVGGNLKVASFNVLNYFTTLDTGTDICGPLGNQECRGADTASEFTRQRDKIIAALVAIDADVVGLIEIENYPGDVPTADLVNGLNDVMGAGTYNYVATGAIGDDAIRVAFIYKPANVSLVGGFAVLDDPAFTDPLGYGEEKSRPALAQTIMDNTTGGVFTAVVNHLKSKGSSCGSGDDDPEQGNCNLTRTLGAQELVNWLATDPTGSGDPDMMILGDLNAYAMEDPIRALTDGDFTNLVKAYNGDYAYSYTFDGMVGTLDYSLANTSLTSQVTGATIWHINTDEPPVIDYDENYNPPGYYSPYVYRSSDHDPVVVGLQLINASPVCTSAAPSVDSLWPVNHKFVPIEILGVTDPDGDDFIITINSIFQDEPVNADDDGNTEPDGQGVGTSIAEVRAERDGLGNGRVYHISFTADDGFGTCSGVVMVGAPLSMGEGPAVDDGPLYDSTIIQ